MVKMTISGDKRGTRMDSKEILKHVDHTLLAQTATWEEIKQICDDAMTYGTASVCIPAAYVKQAKDYVQDKMAVCTVIQKQKKLQIIMIIINLTISV